MITQSGFDELHNKNPIRNASSDLQRARALYQRFTLRTPGKLKKISIPDTPKIIVAIGRVVGLIYRSNRDGTMQNYRHDFAARSQPLFAVAPDGRSLYMIGGSYKFTGRGIVDRKRSRNRTKGR